MHVRRIVTGHDENGQSVFVYDGPAPRAMDFEDLPGHGFAHLWCTEDTSAPSVPDTDPTTLAKSVVPGPGGAFLSMYSFPPDSVMASPLNPDRAYQQMSENLPGLIERFEPDNPGMHRTPTVDYGVLLSGEIWLELDNGEQRKLNPGDVVIQNSTRHAWRNKSQDTAVMIFCMLGTQVPENAND